MAKSRYQQTKEWRTRQSPDRLREIRREEERRRRERHAEKIKAYRDSWRKENIELHRAQDAAYKRKRRKTDPEGQRRRMAKFKVKQERLLIELAGRERPSCCELCGEKAKTVFDHCHATGQFRGWLCHRCNRTLGQVKDSVGLLEKMIVYIRNGGLGYGPSDILAAEFVAEEGFCGSVEGSGVRELSDK